MATAPSKRASGSSSRSRRATGARRPTRWSWSLKFARGPRFARDHRSAGFCWPARPPGAGPICSYARAGLSFCPSLFLVLPELVSRWAEPVDPRVATALTCRSRTSTPVGRWGVWPPERRGPGATHPVNPCPPDHIRARRTIDPCLPELGELRAGPGLHSSHDSTSGSCPSWGVCTLTRRVLNIVLALSLCECQHDGGIGRRGTFPRQEGTAARAAVRRGRWLDPRVRHEGLEPMAAKMIAFDEDARRGLERGMN